MRILALILAAPQAEPGSLCSVAAEVTQMSGAGILLFGEAALRGQICSSDATADLIAELHFSLGEGPGWDSQAQGRVVLEPDLMDPAVSRWPAFSPPAVAVGVRAVFAFPIRLGAARLGALHLYRDRPGPLSDEQHHDATVMAGVAARSILGLQAAAPPDSVAAELIAEGDFHFVVHQAAGMISVQADISVAEALVLLRARAFGVDRLVADIAADVVNRTMRFGGVEGDDRP